MRFWFILLLVLIGLSACSEPEPPPTATRPPLTGEAAVGQQVFTDHCAACHNVTGEAVLVGPPLTHIGSVAGSRVPNQDARIYLLTSILAPTDYLVEGFEDLMPQNFGKNLTGEEVDALVAYLLTLE